MQLKTLYFGLISEITNCTQEVLSVPKNCNVSQFESLLKDKYQALNTVSYTIAVNQHIVDSDIELNPDYEIALLPPFAGG